MIITQIPAEIIIDQYFTNPQTQELIKSIEKIRIKAKEEKKKFFNQGWLFIIPIYIILGVFIYIMIKIFGLIDRNIQLIMFSILPIGFFLHTGRYIQSSSLESQRTTTQIFNNFLNFIRPGSKFNQYDRLYHGTTGESELFIDSEKDLFIGSKDTIEQSYSNSMSIPLLKNEQNNVIVSLEGVEISIYKNRKYNHKSENGMLYKIIFTNPRYRIKQSIKILPNSNSLFKDNHNRIQLEHQEFEKYFDIYSTDPLETRMILTSTVIDKLSEFMNTQSSGYSFHFFDNIFYIKSTIQSICYINRDNSIENNKSIYLTFYKEIRHIQKLVDALNIDYFNKIS